MLQWMEIWTASLKGEKEEIFYSSETIATIFFRSFSHTHIQCLYLFCVAMHCCFYNFILLLYFLLPPSLGCIVVNWERAERIIIYDNVESGWLLSIYSLHNFLTNLFILKEIFNKFEIIAFTLKLNTRAINLWFYAW